MAKEYSFTPKEREVIYSALEYVLGEDEIRTYFSGYNKSSEHQQPTLEVLVKHFREFTDSEDTAESDFESEGGQQ